ncbi:MAG: SpoIIE family protein phosphatase [Negativicutes bacterium]
MKSSQDRYQTLMKQSFEALALIDIEIQEIVEVNRRFTELLGYSLPEDAPLYVNKVVLDSKENLENRYGKMASQQQDLAVDTIVFRHKNGTVIYAERAGTIIKIDGRDYLLVSGRDMTAERLRQAELARNVEFARRVQRELLPELPDSPFVTIRTLYYPYNFVSADSYHLEWRREGKILRGFLIDVSGHGLATAIQTSSINVLLHEVTSAKLPLIEQLRRINARAAKYFTEGAYAAIVGFELDFSMRELRYVGAGITQFYANARKIESPGMFVGMWADPEFTERKIFVEEGDSFCFLTDGFTDALVQPENAGLWSPGGRIFDADVTALERLAESGGLRDDATGICLQVKKMQ